MQSAKFIPFECLLGLLIGLGCYRQEIESYTVSVPEMATLDCAKIITDQLQRVDGVKSAIPDPSARIIEVKFNSTKMATRNVEFIIAGTGFRANDLPANKEARKALPEGCR